MLFNPSHPTDSLQGFVMSGEVTGGTWAAAIEWMGDTFFSADIPWNSTGAEVLVAINAMTDVLGRTVPGPSWIQAVTPSSAPNWAYGPLPAIPVVIEATGQMSGQALLPFTVTSSLAGVNPQINVKQFRGGGTRWDIWAVAPYQASALKRAACAQAEYRDAMGEDFFIRAQYASVHGPEFQTTGWLPIIGPKVKRELNGSGLIQYSARAVVGTSSQEASVYQRLGGTPIPDDFRGV